MRISRRARGGILGVVVLTTTAMWSITRFQNVSVSSDEDLVTPPIASAVSAVNVDVRQAQVTTAPAELSAASPKSGEIASVDDILNEGRDADPRLDIELRSLSAEVRAHLRGRYAHEPAEKRNRRGTLVFLLGRNLRALEDFVFLETVLTERPCLSLQNCSELAKSSQSHHSAGIATTLAYPQLVALNALDAYLRTGPADDALVAKARSILKIGSRSQDPVVARLAHRLNLKHSRAVASFDQRGAVN